MRDVRHAGALRALEILRHVSTGGGDGMSAEDYARNVERAEQARRLFDMLMRAYEIEAYDVAVRIERQLADLLGLNAPPQVEVPS
jgi:hypothetical protein